MDPVAELPGLNPDSTNYREDLTKLVHVSVPQFPHHQERVKVATSQDVMRIE